MKKQLVLGLLGACVLSGNAQTFKEWQDPEINAINRAPMHANFFAYENAEMAAKAVKEDSKNFMSLNGTWKFFWVRNADARPTDFWKTGFNDKGWDNLPGARSMGNSRIRRPYLHQRRLWMAQPFRKQSSLRTD